MLQREGCQQGVGIIFGEILFDAEKCDVWGKYVQESVPKEKPLLKLMNRGLV